MPLVHVRGGGLADGGQPERWPHEGEAFDLVPGEEGEQRVADVGDARDSEAVEPEPEAQSRRRDGAGAGGGGSEPEARSQSRRRRAGGPEPELF